MLRNLPCFAFLLLASLNAHAAPPTGVLLASPAPGSNLVDFKKGDNIPVADLNARIKRIFSSVVPPPAKDSVDLYKVRYRSKNEKGSPIILSALLALPHGGAPRGLVIFNHGTTGDRAMSPSRFTGKSRAGEAQWGILAFATGGYGVAMPDYMGLGDDPGAHPYPLWKLNSQSAIDLIAPARSVAAKNKVALGAPLYMTGYSEGGAVTMWAARTLEAKSVPLAAVAPLSGPYDLSGETRKALLAPSKNLTEFAAQLYLTAYTAHYFNKSRGIPLTNYFKPALAKVVANIFDSNLSDEDIVKRLVISAFFMGLNSNDIKEVMAPRFLKALKSFDTTDPLLDELKKNDCYDWAPRSKTLLVALKNDAIVTDANLSTALKAMRARGVTSATLQDYLIQDPKLTHLTAPATSLALARQFFDGGFAAVGK